MPSPVLVRTAPHSSEAERTVIGALLLDPDAIFTVAPQLSPADFYDPVYRDIYDAIRQLSEKGMPVDFVTVADSLSKNPAIQNAGGSALLADLAAGVPTASHVSRYVDIVLEKSRRRRLADIGSKIAKLAHEEAKTADELTEMAEREFLALCRTATDDDPSRLADLRSERYDHYVTLYEADDPVAHYGIRTGFPPLDDLLTGLAPGQLIVVAGRPGMGKTAFALDIARSVAVDQGKVVSIVSLEMSKEEVFDRLFAKTLGVECWRLHKGLLSEDQFASMGPLMDEIETYPIYVDDDPNATLVNIRSKARRHQMRYGLDLLIIDYLQLIEVTDRLAGENQTQRITYISKNLKALARELHCPVIALSQLSRECDRRPDKRPVLSDLRDSGSIEQDGDRILMLYRESEYDDECDDPDRTDVYIRKNRHGPTGHVALRFDRKTMSFGCPDPTGARQSSPQ